MNQFLSYGPLGSMNQFLSICPLSSMLRLKSTLCYMLCASQKIQNGTSENIFTVRDISTVRTRSEKCCQIWYLISNQSALQSTILLWIRNDVKYIFQKPAAPIGIHFFSMPCAVPYTVKKRLAIFPSPAGMSQTKLSLAGIKIFPGQEEFG